MKERMPNANVMELGKRLLEIQEKGVDLYKPVVESIIADQCSDARHIQHILDFLLDFAGHPEGLALYKSLCRYYYTIDPVATAEYVHFYREMWDMGEAEVGKMKSEANTPSVPKGYKQTEVGVIPDDWEVTIVGREFTIQLGKMLDAEKNVGVSKPYLGNKAVQWDRIDISALPTVPLSKSDLEKFRLKEGDLLVCEGGEAGRAAIWNSPIDECYYQKAIHRLRPIGNFEPKLMVAILRQWSERGMLANHMTQTSIAHLPRDKFLEVPIPLPPVSEQTAIATALSDVDALLDGLDRLIAKKRDLKQAAMQQLLTSETRLPGFEGEWEVKRLGELGVFLKGSGVKKDDSQSGPIPCVRYGELYTHHHEYIKTFYSFISSGVACTAQELKQGDILFAGSGETREEIGKCAAFVDCCEAYAGGDIVIFRPQGLYPLYLGFCLNMPSANRQKASKGQGDAVVHISATALASLVVNIPLEIEEQTAIATVPSDMDAEIAALEQRRNKTKDIKQAMMQELLTGKTRLV